MKLLSTMGCGRSKLANKSENESNDYYHKKCNSVDKGRRSSGGPVEEVKTPGKSLSSSSGSGRSASLTSNGELNKNSGKENKEFPTGSRYNERNKSGMPLQANPSVTSSQLEFFRMLDEKIEKGRGCDDISES